MLANRKEWSYPKLKIEVAAHRVLFADLLGQLHVEVFTGPHLCVGLFARKLHTQAHAHLATKKNKLASSWHVLHQWRPAAVWITIKYLG